MTRRALWFPMAVCAMSLVSAPVTAGQEHGQGQGQDKPDKAQPPGQAKQNAKAPKGAHGSTAKHVDERARFHGLDRDRDGVVTRAEWDGDGRSFASHDWNHDGVLSGAEVDPGAPRQAVLQPRPLPPHPPAPAPKVHTESDEVLFARMDANHDQRLSRGEWVGGASTFERLDFNKDGWLSPYEYGVGR